MKSLKVVVSVLAIALLMMSTIAYFLNLPLSGYILWFAVPLCVIALYLSLKPKNNAEITPILMLMLTMFFLSPCAVLPCSLLPSLIGSYLPYQLLLQLLR